MARREHAERGKGRRIPALATLVAAGAVALAAPACGVPRSEPPPASAIDFSTLPNLRRAREALEDRIAREREYAAALMQQLEQWQEEEDRIFKEYLQAEHDFQLISSDLAGTQADLAEATQERDALQADLAARRKEIASLRAELRGLLDELTRLHGVRDEIEALAASLGDEAPAAGDGGGEGDGGGPDDGSGNGSDGGADGAGSGGAGSDG